MKNYLTLFLLFLGFISFGQKATISGYVQDAATGEKLIGASVYEGKLLYGTTTNAYGFFSLTLDTGEVELVISYISYQAQTEKFSLNSDKFFTILLENDNSQVGEVIVSGDKAEQIHRKTQMSSVRVPMKQIEKLPAFMGERDVLKTIQLTPGVQSGSEGSSGLYVRGGGPDQNLILLDGVPVYNASHLFGFFSVFNSSALNHVEITKGGFPARFGGRVSSVLDIRMKEGNMKEFSGEASFGIIASKLTLEGPIVKDKTSFIISGRRTYIDILTQPFIKAAAAMNGAEMTAGYYFYDVNAKINHKFSDKSRLYLSTYNGKDKAYLNIEDDSSWNGAESTAESDNSLSWGNTTTVLRYNHIINSKLFANVTGTYSRYNFNIGVNYKESDTYSGVTETEEFGLEYLSGIYDWGGKVDFDYLPNPNHYIRFGLAETYHTFKPGVNSFTAKSNDFTADTTFGASDKYAHELAAYFEDDFKIGSRLKVNAGLNLSAFVVDDTTYMNLQPRLSTSFLIMPNFAFKASYSRMAQYLHLLTNGTIGLPTDLWVPVTDSVPPITADQFALGFAYTLLDEYEFSIEGYYKKMNNLIEYKDGATFMGSSDPWDQKIEIGTGESYGLEFFLQKKSGNTSGWIGYTLSWSNRTFENLNFGRTFPYKYDRRHDVSIAIVHEIDRSFGEKEWKLDLGATWVYGTGNAISLPSSSYMAADIYSAEEGFYYNSEIQNYESRNDFREPAYHRLDLSMTFTKEKKTSIRSWNISVYNAYNNKNPFYLYFDTQNDQSKILKQISLFPIIPSVSYHVKF